MIEIRIHGRGGQGAVIASKVLAHAFFQNGKWVQAFPAFGVERRGAPVTAFLRVDDAPIRVRCQIYRPDQLLVLDPTLLHAVDVTTGFKQGGLILINSEVMPEALVDLNLFQVATVDANAIAIAYGLGSLEQPIVNTAILGAYAKASGLLTLEEIGQAIEENVPISTQAQANVAAARQAYEQVRCPATSRT